MFNWPVLFSTIPPRPPNRIDSFSKLTTEQLGGKNIWPLGLRYKPLCKYTRMGAVDHPDPFLMLCLNHCHEICYAQFHMRLHTVTVRGLSRWELQQCIALDQNHQWKNNTQF